MFQIEPWLEFIFDPYRITYAQILFKSVYYLRTKLTELCEKWEQKDPYKETCFRLIQRQYQISIKALSDLKK